MMSKKENQQFIAHVRQNEKGEWLTHDLKEHCQKVGNLAAQFAGHFGEGFAQFAGDYHDIGKYRKPFQERIRIKSGYHFDKEAHLEQKANKASHSHAGALLMQQNSAIGIILAYIIAGHHTGLPDWINDKSACLSSRLRSDEAKTELTQALENLPDDFRKLPDDFAQLLPNFIKTGNLETLHIWIRFLFSCLVDADFLDTEQFMSPQKRVLRSGYPSLSMLEKRFSKYMRKLQRTTKNTPINLIRNDIFQQCLDAGNTDASLFSLTVPTGGGKTLSSMAFALTHAIQFKKQRIIYAIPFTSIIEQNAQVFKHIFEYQDNQHIETCVLEHHSNLEQPLSEETTKNRLAAENWDVPIIVTTNVQLFESLFASRTSQCRKIHNIANSVIVLDEAQKIPRNFQKPITDMMRELSKNYNVTWLLCTATQPKLDKQQDSFGNILLEGLPELYRIIKDEELLAAQLQRVTISFPKANDRLTWEQVAEKITNEIYPCVLAIVNTRNDANELYQQIRRLNPDAIIIHLSASMCPQHRELMIIFINEVLKYYHQNTVTIPFYVISTQLIEAGVDVDFPIVYRAMAGLDSIAQSAGRCNREGRLPHHGKVVVFQPVKDAPQGELRQAQQATKEILDNIRNNPLSPRAFYDYFRLFNSMGEQDKYDITTLLSAKREDGTDLSIAFRTASERFTLINDNGVSVVCPFYHAMMKSISNKIQKQKAVEQLLQQHQPEQWITVLNTLSICPNEELPIEQWLNLLEQDIGNRWIYRKIQRYTVTIPQYVMEKNSHLFTQKAGLYIAKEYNFFTGVVCDLQLSAGNECIW